MKNGLLKSLVAIALIAAFSPATLPEAQAQNTAGPKVVSCSEFLVPKVEIKGKLIGQEDCKMMETDFTLEGRQFRRMDMGISGTIDGYVTREGRYNNYFLSN